jgi:uncharacterized repeat protein (TIGR01451 family)
MPSKLSQTRARTTRTVLAVLVVALAAALAGTSWAIPPCPDTGEGCDEPEAPDLVVAVAASPSPATVGEPVTFSVTVTNGGYGRASGITLTSPVPAGTQLASALPSRGTCWTQDPVHCDLGSLDPQESVTVPIVVVPGQTGTVSSTASASVGGEANAADNEASASVPVGLPAGSVAADVALTSGDSPDPATEGETLTYTLSVQNGGPSTAAGVVLRDVLPPEFELSSTSASQGQCQGTTTVTCQLGSLPSGASALVRFTGLPADVGTITSRATVTGAVNDPTAANNAVDETTTVIAAPPRDLRATGLEINQGVQREALPLNTGAPIRYDGVKLVGTAPTVVRLFANRVGGSSRPTLSVPARLEGFVRLPGGGEQSLGPPLSPVSGPRDVPRGGAGVTLAERGDPLGAHAFLLPQSWTDPDRTISLRAVVNPSDSMEAVPECAGCDANNSIKVTDISFERSPSITVSPVQVRHTPAGGSPVIPSPPPQVFRQTRAILPVSDFAFRLRPYVGTIDVSDLANDSTLSRQERSKRVFERIAAFEISNQPGFTIGISKGLVRGLAAPVFYFWPTRFEPIASADEDLPLISVGHEFFHQLGYFHAGRHPDCQVEWPAVDWPPDNRGYIHGVGLDRRLDSGGSPGTFAIKAPSWPTASTQYHDLMSYCASEADAWISTENWGSFGGVFPSGVLPAFGTPTGERVDPGPNEPTLHVLATIDESGAGEILSVRRGHAGVVGGGEDGEGEAAHHRLVVRNADGEQLFAVPVTAGEGHSHDGGGRLSVLSAQVPAKGAERIELVHHGEVLAELERSAHRPTVELLSPTGTDRVGEGQDTTVRWDARDEDGGELTASVEYSTDDGQTWRLLTAGVRGSGARLPSSMLSATETGRVRVTVNDGFNEAVAVSERFSAVGAAPEVRIVEPAPGASLYNDGTLNLFGEAYDDAGNRLDPGGLRWFDGDEPLGQGEALTVTGLAPGHHELRLVARDSRGRTGSAAVSVDMVAAPADFLRLELPDAVDRAADGLTAGVASTVPATLIANGRRFPVDRRMRRVRLPLEPGDAPGVLRLQLVAGGKTTATVRRVARH